MFEKRIAEIEARKLEIRELLERGEPELDLEKINAELEAMTAEMDEIRKREDTKQRILDGTAANLKTIATIRQDQQHAVTDRTTTDEYRRAFMEYATRGKKSDMLEFRTTVPGDIGAVIPTVILDRIIEKIEEYARIWNRVVKTSLQGGVQIPVSTAKPTATWVAAGTLSNKQKKTVDPTDSIVFSYHKLQCRVAVELVAGTIALPAFERTISANIAEAMAKALDAATLVGDGNGEPLGIINHTFGSDQIATISAANFKKYEQWVNLLAKVPRSYRAGSLIIMNDTDWNASIIGMVDSTGQPIARMNYGLTGTIEERFLGREVIAIEDYLPSITDATAGDTVAILCRLSDYMYNSNMDITYRRYFDEDSDEWVSKATMIADGKLADSHGVILINKA